MDLARRGVERRRRRDARTRRAAEREVQPRRGAHDGASSAASASAPKLRDAGLPADYPNDVVFRTTVTGHRAGAHPDPVPRATATRDTSGPDGWWPTPEPPHRINQIYLEPILFAHAAAHAGRDDPQPHARSTASRRTSDGVTAHGARPRQRRRRCRSRARYLVGCDGGRSLVRKAIGAKLAGTPVIQRVQSTYIRAPQLLGAASGRAGLVLLRAQPAPLRHRASRSTAARPGWSTTTSTPSETDFDAVDRDCVRSAPSSASAPTSRTRCISKEDWIGRRLVADRFRDRRVFICGDAAHLWVPYAGYGMNAGIADALNLSWLLAAHLARLGRRRRSSTPTRPSGCRSPSRSRASRWTMRSR